MVLDSDHSTYGQTPARDEEDTLSMDLAQFRQLTGMCGADEPNPKKWTAKYDSDDGDDQPDGSGKVQLNLFLCCPFGEYELELKVESSSPSGSSLEQRTSWEVENGDDEYHIWDTVNTDLKDDGDYSPKSPGTYTWPLPGATGYYSKLYAGPLPPIYCESGVPSGTVYEGCYEDSASSRTFKQDDYHLPGKENPTGMTPKVCSDFCAEYDYFGLGSGDECYCGTASEFSSAKTSSKCGTTYPSLCSGDSTMACGGDNALSVYGRMGMPPSPPPPVPAPGPKPVPPLMPSSSYTYEGCFADGNSRIMDKKASETPMSSEVCFKLCDDGDNKYFGTQYSEECWCGVDPDLTAHGERLPEDQCDMDCAGTDKGEKCGDRYRMSVYRVSSSSTDPPPPKGYMGCYTDKRDDRTMPHGRYDSEDMTNEMCLERCSSMGYPYAGTEYAVECWCGDSMPSHGPSDECDDKCGGDPSQICGGYEALSVWRV